MVMKKLTSEDPETKSLDLFQDNFEQLKRLFPEIVTEDENGKVINVDVLKGLVGDQTVTDTEEKYGLTWFGKKQAKQFALTPSTGTLRPCPEDSVDWDTTQNLMIEGDNLEVLKLLQKSYAGKVKMIYIDPPYNTGKDFVYPDNYSENLKNYQQLMGWRNIEGVKQSTFATKKNTENSGRFHTGWLNMIYPRLKLARNLLRDDGVIFISIDDGELDNLRNLCLEIFGEENFIVQIIWRKRSTPPNDKVIGANHDYILCYSKDASIVKLQLRERSKEQIDRYSNPDNHPKGPWAPGDLMANVKGGRYVKSLYFPIVNPNTSEEHFPGNNGNWRFSADTIAKLMENNEISFGSDGLGKPKLKRFLCDVKEGVTYPSIWDFVPLNTSGTNEMDDIFGNPTIFESPKPTGLIQELIKLGSDNDSIILDFFAGSGTTGHAVIKENSIDMGKRHFILVQLPEIVTPDSEAYKSGFRNIADLTKERLRRAVKKIKNENPIISGDMGFRVYKLDSSNIHAWDIDKNDIPTTLQGSIEHLKIDRSEMDILYEVLLKLGLDLCIPIETRTIAGKTVYSTGGGVLMACLATSIKQEEVESLALEIVNWHKEQNPAGETTCIFRDDAFVDDVAKTNLSAILNQYGINNVRSL